MMTYIDLSHDISDQMPIYPGDVPVQLSQSSFLARDHYNGFTWHTGLHAGTHLDFPLHLLHDKPPGSTYPLEQFCGSGRLLSVVGQREIGYNSAWEAVREGEIILVHTGWDQHFGSALYYENYPRLTTELAAFLTERKIRLLGLDTPSPDYPPFPVHKLLLGQGICIVENLTGLKALQGVEVFEAFMIPLKIAAEASLIRAFARYQA